MRRRPALQTSGETGASLAPLRAQTAPDGPTRPGAGGAQRAGPGATAATACLAGAAPSITAARSQTPGSVPPRTGGRGPPAPPAAPPAAPPRSPPRSPPRPPARAAAHPQADHSSSWPPGPASAAAAGRGGESPDRAPGTERSRPREPRQGPGRSRRSAGAGARCLRYTPGAVRLADCSPQIAALTGAFQTTPHQLIPGPACGDVGSDAEEGPGEARDGAVLQCTTQERPGASAGARSLAAVRGAWPHCAETLGDTGHRQGSPAGALGL